MENHEYNNNNVSSASSDADVEVNVTGGDISVTAVICGVPDSRTGDTTLTRQTGEQNQSGSSGEPSTQRPEEQHIDID